MRNSLHVVWANLQSIYYLFAGVSVLAAGLSALTAARAYRRTSSVDRARWLSEMYSKFYEKVDLKRVRETLDGQVDSPAVQKLVTDQDPDFTDYLNFFEFMAYLEDCGQLTKKDVVALFDYYLRILNRHSDVRKYIQDDGNGYGYLSKLLSRFS